MWRGCFSLSALQRNVHFQNSQGKLTQSHHQTNTSTAWLCFQSSNVKNDHFGGTFLSVPQRCHVKVSTAARQCMRHNPDNCQPYEIIRWGTKLSCKKFQPSFVILNLPLLLSYNYTHNAREVVKPGCWCTRWFYADAMDYILTFIWCFYRVSLHSAGFPVRCRHCCFSFSLCSYRERQSGGRGSAHHNFLLGHCESSLFCLQLWCDCVHIFSSQTMFNKLNLAKILNSFTYMPVLAQ